MTRALSHTVPAIVFSTLLLTSCSRTPQPSAGTSSLGIFYNAEEQPTEKSAVAQVLQAQLTSKGISATLEPVSNTIFNDRLAKGSFQATLALWYLDYDDPEGFLTDFYSKSGFRMSKYNNPEYDKVYLSGLFSTTPEQERQRFTDAASILDRELPWVPLYSNSEVFLLAKGAEGFRSDAYQYYDYRQVQSANIHAATDVEVQTLDPALAYDLASKHIVTQSYEGLVARGASGLIEPALASEWKVSSAGDRIDFVLRSGVHFHGQWNHAVTASDVKASFQRMLKSNSPYSYIFDHVAGVDDFRGGKASSVSGFVTEGDLHFSILLTQPMPVMIKWLLAPAAYILPHEVSAKYDLTKGSIGTGPFVLQSWNGAVATFIANSNYWKPSDGGQHLPLAKSLTIRVMKEANTQQIAFRRGELDILNVPLALFTDVFDSQGTLKPEWHTYTYREVKLNNLKFLAFNMNSSPWGQSADLRRKVAQAIDRQAIVQQMFLGKARPATSVIPPEMFAAPH